MTADLPTVAVVVPARDAEVWIGETLRSVLALRYPADLLEVAVVDDGSTDGTAAAALAALRQASLRWQILATAGRGPSHARNVGWRATSARWVQFLDADDLLHLDKLAVQATAAAALPDDVALVYSDWQALAPRDGCWRPDGPRYTPAIGPDAVSDLLATENFIATGSQLVRRVWLEQVGGWDERHRLIEDVDLMLRLALAGGRFVRVPAPEPLFLYRRRSDSLSRSRPREFVEGCLRNARLAEDHWQARGGPTPKQAARLADVYLQGVRAFAGEDPALSGAWAERIAGLVPGYLPPGSSWRLRCLARVLGLGRAEAVAARCRRLRRWLRPRRPTL